MPLHIVIDARRLRDFGIGTYIRSLIVALGGIDRVNRYTIVCNSAGLAELNGLPENFAKAVYERTDLTALDHLAFPVFLRRLSPDLVHIPLNRVPLFMPRPYVVTIHDMANLLFDNRSGLRMNLRRFRFRRGQIGRASC